MAKNNKNLVKMDTIISNANKYENTEFTTIGDNFDIEFYPYFSDDKIKNVVENIGAFLNSEDKDSKSFVESFSSSDEDFVLLVYFFVTKEFTHLGVDMKDKDTPAKLFPYYHALIKTGLLTELVEDVFLPEEMQKVFHKVASISAIGEHMNQIGMHFFDEVGKHKDKLERLQSFDYSSIEEKTEVKTPKKSTNNKKKQIPEK